MLHFQPKLSALAKFEVLSALRRTVLQGFPVGFFLRRSLHNFCWTHMPAKHRGLQGFRNCFESHLSLSKIRYVMGSSQQQSVCELELLLMGCFPAFLQVHVFSATQRGPEEHQYHWQPWHSLWREAAHQQRWVAELYRQSSLNVFCSTGQISILISGKPVLVVLYVLLYCKPCTTHILRLDAALEFFLLKAGRGWYFCHPAAVAANGYSCMVCWLISALSFPRKSLILIILIAFHEVLMILIYAIEVHKLRNVS